MNIEELLSKLKTELNESYEDKEREFNEGLLDERITDAKSALKDVLGYLKQFGRGDADDIEVLREAINILTEL